MELFPRNLSRVGSITSAKIGTQQHFRWLEWIVASVLVLNTCDALFTIAWVYTGRATEANPMMAELVHRQPFLFVLTKSFLVISGSFILWAQRRRPIAVIAIFVIFVAYYLVLLVHVQAFDLHLFPPIFEGGTLMAP